MPRGESEMSRSFVALADGGEVRRGLAVGLEKEETQNLAVHT